MKYIVFPIEKLNEISQEVLNELHLSPRKSVDGTKVIMKVDSYEKLFPLAMMIPELPEGEMPNPVYEYPTYEGVKLDALLNSNAWTNTDNPVLQKNVLDDTSTVLSSTRKTTSKKK